MTRSTGNRSSGKSTASARQDRSMPFARHSGSLSRMISVVLGLMIILVLLTSGAGLWYAYQSGQKVGEMRTAATQAVQVSELQLKWLAVVGTLESISVNRPNTGTTATQIQLELDSKLGDLENKLTTLGKTQLGLSPEIVAANQETQQDLIQLGTEMRKLSSEVYDLTVRNRWSQAMTRRQSGLAELENRLDKDLSSLNKNIQADLETSTRQVERLRQITTIFSSVIAILAIAFASLVVWAARRAIINPMQLLTGQVQQVAQGDFSPVTPLDRRDEIGELSRAIALMTDWLRDSYELLEQRVAERTQEVERRRTEIQVSAQVARDIASTRNLDALLNLSVNLIRDRFSFYHAGIFLNDDRGEFAVLRSATGEAGRALLERQHRLRIGSAASAAGMIDSSSGVPVSTGSAVGLVGYAAQTGESRVALDVGQDAVHFKNPLLPDTRSEAAIPLKTGGRMIGVLDVQSVKPNAFDAENLQVFQVMADQLATAIQNARLLEEVQQNLNELQTAYGQVDRQAWQRFTQTSPLVGYQYDGIDLVPLTRQDPAGGAKQVTPAFSEAQSGELLKVPLQVRGSEIGALEVWGKQGELSESEKVLLNSVSSRLSQILESARLFEEAQSRAAREEMINRLTASLARSLDTDGALRAAAFQLGNLPSVTEATVYLAPHALADQAGSPDQGNAAAGEPSNGGGNGHRS